MQVFQNFQLCLKAWNLPLAINILSDFPWNGRFILLFFRKTSAKYPTWNNCNLSVSFSSKIAIREKKKGACSFCITNNYKSTLLWVNYWTSVFNRNALCIFLILLYRIFIKRQIKLFFTTHKIYFKWNNQFVWKLCGIKVCNDC